MKNNIFLVVCTLLLFCGKTSKSLVSEKQENKIEVTKFMYSVNTYPMAIYEKTFWVYKEEHAKLDISIDENGNFLEAVKKLPKNDGHTFELFNYAFVVKNNGTSDTIYSDGSLKTFLFRENGKFQAHYDEKGHWAEQLRNNYSFFKSCW